MKSYEQKYKELLWIVKNLYPNMTDYQKEKFEGVCPELAESEDKKIRNGLISYLKDDMEYNPSQKREFYESSISWLEKQKPVELRPHRPNGYIAYDRGFEEAQEYISQRGFDIPWNDNDVFIDGQYITQTVANVLTWADEHPKQKPVEDEWIEDYWKHNKVNNPYSYDKGDEIQFDYNGFKKFCNQFTQKPLEWTEEDDIHLQKCIELAFTDGYLSVVDWLKSLKERINHFNK